MLMAYSVRPGKRAAIPATAHVDGTGRLRTVNARQNPLYCLAEPQLDRIKVTGRFGSVVAGVAMEN